LIKGNHNAASLIIWRSLGATKSGEIAKMKIAKVVKILSFLKRTKEIKTIDVATTTHSEPFHTCSR